MIIYLIKCTIAMGVAWSIYRLFLTHQKSFVLNRIYLLTAIIGTTLAPFIALHVALPKLAITDNIYPIGDLLRRTHTESIDNAAAISAYSFSDYITGIIIAISILCTLRFIYRMFKLIELAQVASVENKERINIAIINDGRTPFSFFNTIYVDLQSYTSGIQREVFLHEKYHIQQWHSLDRIIIEIISIVQWMNPFLYLLKRDLIDNHEYASDAYAIRQTNDSQSYLSLILSKAQSSSSQNFLLQQFSHSSPIKRIKMITTIQQVRKIWFYPFAFLLLLVCLFSCSDDLADTTNSEYNLSHEKNKTSELNYKLPKLTQMGFPMPPPPPVPKINRPSKELLEKWATNINFKISIDGEPILNSHLNQYNPTDFSLFQVGIHKKTPEVEQLKYKNKVQLLTNQGYLIFKSKAEKMTANFKKDNPSVIQ